MVTKEEYMAAQEIIAQWEREQTEATVIPVWVRNWMDGYTNGGESIIDGKARMMKKLLDFLRETDRDVSLITVKRYVTKYCNEKGMS